MTDPFDPFADEPPAPFAADTVITSTTPIPNEKTTTTKDEPMKNADDTATGITATLKGGAGFDAPWVVVHAADAAHLATMLDSLTKDVMSKVASAASLLQGEVGPSTPARGGARSAAPAAPVAAAPAGSARMCIHGERVHRTGQGAKGPWQGWFCPTPKGTPDQCPPQWK